MDQVIQHDAKELSDLLMELRDKVSDEFLDEFLDELIDLQLLVNFSLTNMRMNKCFYH